MATKTKADLAGAALAPAENILCAADFTNRSLSALQAARSLAVRWGATLEVVCAADLPALPMPDKDVGVELRALDAYRRRVQAKLRSFAGDGVSCLVRDGPAQEAIVNTARERSSGLIVLGTHGRAGLPRIVLGSTAEAVIAETEVPVLVVPHAPDGRWPRKVLVAMKYTDYASRALIYGDAFARSLKAPVGVIHVIEPGEAEDAVETLRQHVGRVLGGSAEFMARESRYETAEAILREAEAGGYDLIVMAAHRKPFWRDWTFGMTVQRLLRYSTVPVVSVGSRG